MKLRELFEPLVEGFIKKRAKDGKHWIIADNDGGELPGFGLFDDDTIQAKLDQLNGKK
jgi:hypothetical protein